MKNECLPDPKLRKYNSMEIWHCTFIIMTVKIGTSQNLTWFIWIFEKKKIYNFTNFYKYLHNLLYTIMQIFQFFNISHYFFGNSVIFFHFHHGNIKVGYRYISKQHCIEYLVIPLQYFCMCKSRVCTKALQMKYWLDRIFHLLWQEITDF